MANQTINEGKELAQARRPLLLAVFTFPDGSMLRVSTIPCTFGGHTYEPVIVEQEVERLASLSEQGVDRVPAVSMRLADPDGALFETWERGTGKGFKGSTLTLTFALHDPTTGEFSTDSFVPFPGICDQPGIDEKGLTITATSRLNLTRYSLPTVPIQVRCPWVNPATAEQRAAAADPKSRFWLCGETRSLGAAPPCQQTKQTCTQPARYGGVTLELEKTGSGREYISGNRIAWRNPDTSGKYREFWPLWLGGKAWINAIVLNQWADGNYTRGEAAIGFGAIEIDKVVANGVELSPGMTGDYRWHYVNQGARDGQKNPDVGYESGDVYGNCTVIQFLAPHSVISPDGEVQLRVRGRRKTLRVYRRIVSAAGSGGNIVITFDGPNEDCAGNPPFTVTVEGNSLASGTHTLVDWQYGPPGTITINKTGSGNVAGGRLYYEVSASVPGSLGGAATPWVLAEALRWSRFEYDDLDLDSFADAAKICNALIQYVDADGNAATQPRFSSAIALRERRSASEVVRGIRQSIGALLVPGPDGKLQLKVEGPLAEQQPAPVDGSNYNTPVGSTLRNGAAAVGYVAYRFDVSNSWGMRRIPRPVTDAPNRVQFTFQDPSSDFAVSEFSVTDSDDVGRIDQQVPGGLQVEPEGIASHNHAWRIARLGLNKIHRGNPRGDTRGTEWWEWQTSFRGCKLAVGQIVALDNERLGLNGQLFRLTEIKPARNYETVTLRGHWHTDAWYLDAPPDLADPRQEVLPYEPPAVDPSVIPLAPNVTAATAQAYYCDADGNETPTGRYYGLKGTVDLPTEDPDYGHLMRVRVMVTDPAPGTRRQEVFTIHRPDFTGTEVAWKTSGWWPRPAGNMTFQRVEWDCENEDGKITPDPYAVEDVLVVGLPDPPDLPVAVTCSEYYAGRYVDHQNNTKTFLDVVVNLAPGSTAEWVRVWLSLDNGATWQFTGSPTGFLGDRWLSEPLRFEIYAPKDGEKTARVKVVTNSSRGQNEPEDAVVSAAFTIQGLGTVPELGAITDAQASYTVDFQKCPWAFYPTITWTNNLVPPLFASLLTVKLCNAAGDVHPDPKYQETPWGQIADWSPRMGANQYSEPLGWMLPSPDEPANGFRYFHLFLVGEKSNGERNLVSPWTGGADHAVMYVQESRKAEPPGQGLTLGSNGKVKLGTTNPSGLFSNPGFEDDFAHWTPSGCTIETSGAYTGSKCVRMPAGGHIHQGFYNPISVRPGEKYRCEVHLRFDAGSTGSVRIDMICRTGAGGSASTARTLCPATTGETWTRFAVEGIAPAGASSLYVHILYDQGGPTGAAYVDNVYLTKVKTAEEVLLGAGLLPVDGAVALDTNGDVMIDPVTNSPVLKQAVVDSSNLAPGSIGADLSKYASSKRPIGIYYGLPSPVDMTAPDVIFNTADGKLYRRLTDGTWRWEKGVAPADILAGTIGAQVAYLGTVYSNKIVEQGGGIFGCRLTLQLNGVVASVDNQYSSAYGDYAGVVVKKDSQYWDWHALMSYNGFAIVDPLGYRSAELSMRYFMLADDNGSPFVEISSGGSGDRCLIFASPDPRGFRTGISPYEVFAHHLQLYEHTWRSDYMASPAIRMGDYSLWIDSSGRLRIKYGIPTSDTDGVVVGTQS